MTERQYLDTISAPRIDPIYQGQRVMLSRPWQSDDEDDVSGEESEDPVLVKEEFNENTADTAMDVDGS
jgi:hypothetical protein